MASALPSYASLLISLFLLLIVSPPPVLSAIYPPRMLNWGTMFKPDYNFNGNNSKAILFVCSDTLMSSYLSYASQSPYTAYNGTIAANTFYAAMCAYLRPNATLAAASKAKVIQNIITIASVYYPVALINIEGACRQICMAFDLVRPDLDVSTILLFSTGFVEKLLPDFTAWEIKNKGAANRDNFLGNLAGVQGVCAQAVNNSLWLNNLKVNLTRQFSHDESVSSVFVNGTSYDVQWRDALFYHIGAMSKYIILATFLPDYFFTADQWQMMERGVWFLKQFYNQSVSHREFLGSQYTVKVNGTNVNGDISLHPTLYNHTWLYSDGDGFMYSAYVPFPSVRNWTYARIGTWKYGSGHTPSNIFTGLPYGLYDNSNVSFGGAYDNLTNDFSLVGTWVMRPVDYYPLP